MKGIGLEQVSLSYCFALDGLGELVEEAIDVAVVEISIMTD